MGERASITVGHYEYTAQDAKRTLSELAQIWSHHAHATQIPVGWMAGARGFVAEIASLTGVALPALDDVQTALESVTSDIQKSYASIDDQHIGAALAAMWRFFPTMRGLSHDHRGTVTHIHASRGLPKKSIDHAIVGWKGIEGDVQTARAHHGRPFQALCIWSEEIINELRSQGDPISPGFAGENFTVSGISWQAMRPGARFSVGTIEGFLSAYTIPCSQNKDWFADGDFRKMSHERGDVSRVYAMVTRTGLVAVGDQFELFSDR